MVGSENRTAAPRLSHRARRDPCLPTGAGIGIVDVSVSEEIGASASRTQSAIVLAPPAPHRSAPSSRLSLAVDPHPRRGQIEPDALGGLRARPRIRRGNGGYDRIGELHEGGARSEQREGL